MRVRILSPAPNIMENKENLDKTSWVKTDEGFRNFLEEKKAKTCDECGKETETINRVRDVDAVTKEFISEYKYCSQCFDKFYGNRLK